MWGRNLAVGYVKEWSKARWFCWKAGGDKVWGFREVEGRRNEEPQGRV